MPLPLVVTAAATGLFKTAFWGSIFSFVMSIIVPVAIQLMVGFGVGFIAYQGFDIVLSSAESYVLSRYNNLPTTLWQMLTLAGVDAGIKIVLAAVAGNMVLKLGNAAMTRRRIMPWKKPGTGWEA